MTQRHGWWFARDAAARGDVQRWSGTPIPGRAGLHAAASPLAALPYAKTDRLCRVWLEGVIAVAGDQMAATVRRVEYAIDAGPLLRDLARRSIERLLGEPMRDRAFHLREASAARERVIDCDQRVHYARWALDEGARHRTASERALAEGRVEGAMRAAAEARRSADAHEAAGALLERDDVHAIARAIDHVLRAIAGDAGDEARALGDARAALERDLFAAIEPLIPTEPLPPIDRGGARPAPNLPTGSTPMPAVDDGAHYDTQRTEPTIGAREVLAPPLDPGPGPIADVASAWLAMDALTASARGDEERVEPQSVSDTSTTEAHDDVPPVDLAPSASVQLIEALQHGLERPTDERAAYIGEIATALRLVLWGDPAFVSLHRIPGDSVTLLVRRARPHGSDELLEALRSRAPLRSAQIGFVVCWDAAGAGKLADRWYLAGTPDDRAVSPGDVFAGRSAPSIDLSRIDDQRSLSLVLAGVRRVAKLRVDEGPRVWVLGVSGDPLAALEAASRAGVRRAIAVSRHEGKLTITRSAGAGLGSVTADTIVAALRGSATDPSSPPGGDAEIATARRRAGRAQLITALRSANHVGAYALNTEALGLGREAYVIKTATKHVDAVSVHLARSLPDRLRLTIFVLPRENPATALHERTAGIVAFDPWMSPPIDDYRFIDAVFRAMEGPPLSGAAHEAARSEQPTREPTAVERPAAPARPLRPKIDTASLKSLTPIASAGFVDESATGGAPLFAVWIVDAFAEARARAQLERDMPGVPFVLVTGASRLTPGLEQHMISPSEAARPTVSAVDVMTLAPAIHRALTVDVAYRKRPSP